MTNAHARPPKPKKKHRLVEVTDPAEIAAIQSDAWGSPMGGQWEGKWLAESRTLATYRRHFANNTGERP